jgi:5,10-methylenetetrahydromethanopterin reductase
LTATLNARVHHAGGTALGSVDEVRREALWAADAGFDGFWVSQIFGVDPFVALAAIADEVPDLAELGTSVVPLYGRHPLAMAALALTAQSATGGRFTLGLGPSHQVVVESILGQSYARPATHTEEHLAALIPLLSGATASVDGDEIRAHGSLQIDAPPVPVLLAALGPRMLDIAGRLTDGTTLGQCGPRTIATHIAPRIREAADTAGRPDPRIMALVSVCVTDDIAAARAHAEQFSASYAALPAYRRVLDLEGVVSGAELLIAGSDDQVTEGLAAYVDAGVTDLRIGITAPSPLEEDRTRGWLRELLDR